MRKKKSMNACIYCGNDPVPVGDLRYSYNKEAPFSFKGTTTQVYCRGCTDQEIEYQMGKIR